jgi:transcriptional regulator with XRE-family HTH domain
VDSQSEIRQFLTSRRAKITPERTGLPTYGAKRRVTGLRREEVSLLAGISVEYYTRLERGNTNGVSEDVLEGIARALQLDEAERMHLADLVRGANTTRSPRRRPSQERVRPSVQRILDALDAPAYVRNSRMDILAVNRLGAALYSALLADPLRPANIARFTFLNPRAIELYDGWESIANDSVAILRAEAGRDPYDRRLSDFVGELSTRSESSAAAGPPTTSSSTAAASNASTTPSSERSPSTPRPSTCPATPASGSSSTPPSPARPPPRR